MPKRRKETSLSKTGRLALSLAGLLLGLILCRVFIIPCRIYEQSMVPTLQEGSRVFFLRTGKPKSGDIVLLKSPTQKGHLLVRRVIGAPGDGIEIKNREIFVNGDPLRASWRIPNRDGRSLAMAFTFRDSMPFVKLEQDQLFILGDNWEQSFDSRSFGPVRKKLIKGTLLYVLH